MMIARPRRATVRRPDRRRPRLALEALESRLVLATSSLMNQGTAYAWTVINEMRLNPPKFANELEGLYRKTISSAQGYSASDPIWTDLRDEINRSSYPQHFWDALALMRQQPVADANGQNGLGPFGWEDPLATISEDHVKWMETHTYAHSYYPGNDPPESHGTLPGFKQPGINGDYDIINKSVLNAKGNWSDGSWGENIGFSSGNSLPASRARFGNNGPDILQREVYADVIGFMIEVSSDSLGHLRNLLGRDQMDGRGFGLAGAKNKEIQRLNAIGLAYDPINNFNNDRTNWVATHTFSTHTQYPEGGGYIAGVAYADDNRNGHYDFGEGVNVEFEISDDQITVTTATSGDNYGVIDDYETHNGKYEVTAYAGGWYLGSRIVDIENNNKWVEFRVSPTFGLGFNLTPQLARDFHESGGGGSNDGNETTATAVDLGLVKPGQPLDSGTQALSIDRVGDQDWFRFQVDQKLAVLNADVAFKASDGRLDATLYRQGAGGSLTPVGSPVATTGHASFARRLMPGTYFLKVNGVGNAKNFYSMTTELLPISTPNDFDNDGKADLAIYLSSFGIFADRPSGGASDRIAAFGPPGGLAVAAPGDYDGDGQADRAIYLPAYGAFAYRPSSGMPDQIIPFGPPGNQAIFAPGDYDGDGRSDLAIYLPQFAIFAYRPSSGATDQIIPFGPPGNQAIFAPGDYDGDGRSDLAIQVPQYGVFAIRTWGGEPDQITSFGPPGNLASPAPGDYDGDGKTDLAIYLPAYGAFAYRPSSRTPDQIIPFGTPGNQAVFAPGDYDGDGKTDLAVYLASYGVFAFRPSSGSADQILAFGPGGGIASAVAAAPQSHGVGLVTTRAVAEPGSSSAAGTVPPAAASITKVSRRTPPTLGSMPRRPALALAIGRGGHSPWLNASRERFSQTRAR